jgi:integrase
MQGMKTHASPPPASPEYVLVAECLYRNSASKVYYGLLKRGGKQIRRSLKTTDRKLANRRLAELREKVGRMSAQSAAARLTFAQVSDLWLNVWSAHLKPASILSLQHKIKELSRTFGPLPVRSITRAVCEDWAQMRSPGVAAATFNHDRGTLKLILDHAKREGLILDNPADSLVRRRMEKSAILIPTREQFAKLVVTLRGLDIRYQSAADLVELLAYSGMRKGEANAFRLADVDFDRGTFVVTGGEVGTKNHEARTVPLFPVLRDFLERLQKESPRDVNAPLVAILDAKKALETACKMNCFPHFTHHCMRHFFVSNCLEKGVDFKTIGAWVGHKDGGLLVAKTYGHLRDTHSYEMAKRITL